MDAQKFLAEFGHIANAPGGVGRLRELVLQLAILGRLVPQLADEAMDFTLCTDLKEGEICGPYQIPSGWRWTYFGTVLDFHGGGQPPKNTFSATQREGYVQLLQIRDLGESPQPVFIPRELASKFCTPDDILVGRYGASVGKVFWGKHGSYNVALVKMVDLFGLYDKRFLFVLLKSPLGQDIFGGISRSAQDGFNKKDIEKKFIPVAPVREQSRIVAKVDELMALCDQLEAQQQARRTLQNHLRQATLQTLASATSPHELQTSWKRLADNFGQLFQEPEDVDELRNLIFQLGIRGLLVDQCEIGPEKATAFIRSVQQKRDRLVASGIIRRSTSFPAVDDGEMPFALPRGWKFCRLGEVSICRDGQRVPLSKAEREPRRGGFPYYGASGIIDCIDDYIFDEDLLLVGEDGANLINRSTPIAFIATGRYWVNNHAHVLDTVDYVALRYLELFINAIDLRPYVTGTAQPKMNQEKMNLIVVAVPPPVEQALIVSRIDALMCFCDELENALTKAFKTAERVVVSAVATLTGITPEQQEPPMKAPQTELLAPVRLGTAPDIKAQAPLATLLARHHGEMSAKDLWQRFGGEIDAFYAQLKNEVAQGWILEPAPAEVRELPTDPARA